MTQNNPGRKDWILPLLVLYATILGAAVRLAMPIHSPAPLNDGGLFYSMIVDIQKNNFALPMFTSYNAAQIPLAYPPLALYFTAIISTAFHLSVFDLMRLLPPIVSAVCIPAFYLLAREMLNSQAQVALAVIIFAFIPRTLDWLIMGGGITRTLGLLFALLAMRQFYVLFSTRSDRSIPLAILFGALVVYTHPEAAVHAVLTAVVFYLIKDRSLAGLRRAAIVGVGTVIASAPWWLIAILRHGVASLAAPLAAAGQDSPSLPIRIFSLFQFEFTDEAFLSIIGVLGLIGLVVLLVRRQYLMPVWIMTLFMIEPRGGRLFMMIPHAMMAAVALEGLIIPGLKKLSTTAVAAPTSEPTVEGTVSQLLEGKLAKSVLGFIFAYSIMSAAMIGLTIFQKYTLKATDLEAFQWVKENTQTSARFVLLTGENALRDSSSEWFPALAERRSLGTVFGYEWINDGRFAQRKQDYDSLQACANQDQTCLNTWSEETGQAIDYVYIRKLVEDQPVRPALVEHLRLSNEYKKVYDSSGAAIFQHLAGNP